MAAWEFQMLQSIADRHGWHRFISMQNYYNLLYREEEREMIPYCQADGVGIIPWSPIARGALARPHGERSTLRETTDKFMQALIRGREQDADAKVNECVEQLAKKKGFSMAQIAMAWCRYKGTQPIVGLNKKERIEEAVQSLKVELTPEDISFLESGYIPKAVAPVW
jgi:versiconal hemiacetal acetate reductase